MSLPLEALIGLAAAGLSFAAALVTLIVKVQRVHVLVNNRMSEAMDRIDQLTTTLTTLGADVPNKLDRGRHER